MHYSPSDWQTFNTCMAGKSMAHEVEEVKRLWDFHMYGMLEEAFGLVE